jgi:predicted Zn-dependent protease
MRNRDEALSIIDLAIREAHGDEADAVFVASDRNISRFANSSLHQNMSEREASLTLRVITNGRAGVASTSLITPEEIARIAALARDMANRSEPIDGFKGLPAVEDPTPPFTTFDEATARITPMEKAERLRAMFREGGLHRVTFAGAYATSASTIAVGNSHGIRRHADVTSADVNVIALHDDDSGFATSNSRRNADLDLVTLGDEAAGKALLLRDQRGTIDVGEYDVVLEPPALAEVFEWMNMITFSGRAFEDGSSFFVGHRGEELLGTSLTLADDATDESFLPFPFDMEGVPKRRVDLVRDGVIGTPVVDKLYADRLGMPLTGSAASLGGDDHGTALHLSMAGGNATREELIASTERGIWVTRFNYLNGLLDPKVALMTGMTRDGTFLIEDGRVTKRLPNLRWTQSIVDAFRRIDGLTRERRIVGAWWNVIGGVIAPTTRIRRWNVTGS